MMQQPRIGLDRDWLAESTGRYLSIDGTAGDLCLRKLSAIQDLVAKRRRVVEEHKQVMKDLEGGLQVLRR